VEITHLHAPAGHPGDTFEVEGTGTLNAASNGIAPDLDDVTIGVGPLTLTISAGSFAKTPSVMPTYHFTGVIAGMPLNANIQLGPGNTFQFEFEGRQANLGVLSTVTVTLAIGDDNGQTIAKVINK
jgi:hypothetical protein